MKEYKEFPGCRFYGSGNSTTFEGQTNPQIRVVPGIHAAGSRGPNDMAEDVHVGPGEVSARYHSGNLDYFAQYVVGNPDAVLGFLIASGFENLACRVNQELKRMPEHPLLRLAASLEVNPHKLRVSLEANGLELHPHEK